MPCLPATTPGSRGAVVRFLYASGTRPLDGYVIKRGVGSGGFGEVYYATSDAGKEVALKLIRRNLDTELRGMRQCLNLKHPNLLSLYDIRQDDTGDTWVVMEYMSGKCLESRTGRSSPGLAARRGPGLVPRHRGRRGLSARPRHRPPRPEAGQYLLRRRRGEGGRLRPFEVHLVQPSQRAHGEHRHRPLHGARGGPRPLRQGTRHLRPGRDPLRIAHRPRALRGRERGRSAHEAPHGPARRIETRRALSQRGGPGLGEGPCPAVCHGGRNGGCAARGRQRQRRFRWHVRGSSPWARRTS